MNVHFFKLLQDHYYISTLYYCHVTTHYFIIITVLLLDYCKGTFHFFVIITYLLLLHYVSITTILLPDYHRITTIDCFIIPWSILWLITTWLLQLLPLLPIFITTLIPITTIITIIHPPNLEMIARNSKPELNTSSSERPQHNIQQINKSPVEHQQDWRWKTSSRATNTTLKK